MHNFASNRSAIKEKLGYDTWANAREGVRMAKNGPEVEAIDGPEERQKNEAEIVKPPRVGN